MNNFKTMFIVCTIFFAGYGFTQDVRLNIHEAIALGLDNNPELKRAQELVKAAEGRYWSDISLPKPEISAEFEYIPNGKSISNYSEKTLSITQSFEFPTNYFLRAARAGNEEKALSIEKSRTQNLVRARIIKAYFRVLADRYRIKYLDENLAINQDFLKKAEARYSLGEGTKLEMMTAKVQFIEARNACETAGHALAADCAELKSLLGIKPSLADSLLVLVEQFSFKKTELTIEQVEEWININSQEISGAEVNRAIALIEKKLAVSSLLPSFSLSYMKQSRDGLNEFYGLSAGFSIPLWFPFEQKGKILEAEANSSAAEFLLEQKRREVTLMIKKIFADYQTAFHKAELYAIEMLPQAMEIYQAAAKGYEAGELSYLEYLQAKQTKLNIQETYTNSLLELKNVITEIESVSGREIQE